MNFCFCNRELFAKSGENGAEVVEAGFDVFDNLFGEIFWIGQVIEIGEAFVFQPEDVQAGFVRSACLF